MRYRLSIFLTTVYMIFVQSFDGRRQYVVKKMTRRVPKLDSNQWYRSQAAMPVSYSFRTIIVPKTFEKEIHSKPKPNIDVEDLDYLRRLYESGK